MQPPPRTTTCAGSLADGPPVQVLVVDDQPAVLEAMQFLLKANGYSADCVCSPGEAIAALTAHQYDLLVMDMNYGMDTTSGDEGLQLLGAVRSRDLELGIVVMTGWSSIELAVAALQRGAADFIQKPWDNNSAIQVIVREAERTRRRRSEARIRNSAEDEASRVQRALLGAADREFGEFTTAAVSKPAGNVGGDYYDVVELDESRFGFCIADCMGKGLSAALLMANLQAQFRTALARGEGPAAVCADLNQLLTAASMRGRFVSLFCGILNTTTGELTFTNAGHCPPVIVGNEENHERLHTDDAVLGAIASWNYHQRQVTLNPGDRLVLFTDGLSEAADVNGCEFGEERVAKVAQELRHCEAAEIVQKLLSAGLVHSSQKLADDATLLVIARHALSASGHSGTEMDKEECRPVR